MSTEKKLTAEFMRARHVVFYPQSSADAQAIQQWMFRHGITWVDGSREVSHVNGCVAKGIFVREGKLFLAARDTLGIKADINDLAGLCDDDYPSEARMQRQINRLESEVSALHSKIDMLIDLLQPRVVIDKTKGMKP